jgi:Protein of unknown function (DUF3253)
MSSKKRKTLETPSQKLKKSKGRVDEADSAKVDVNSTSSTGMDEDSELQRLDNTLVDILMQRGTHKTCWPSEIPRKIYPWKTLDTERKKELMVKTRTVAYRRAREGFLEVLQKGEVISNPSEDTVRGPIRLRQNERWKDEDVATKI